MSAQAKPFQEATAKAAVHALRGGNARRRFLVADEVGLGKTVVARDVIASLAAHRRSYTVFYITSGHKVSDQNKADLLAFLDAEDAKRALSTADRVGLIPLVGKLKSRIRLYALTPTTSFPAAARLYGGKAIERAFIALLLDEVYAGLTARFPRGFLRHTAKPPGWKIARDDAARRMKDVPRRFVDAYGKALRTEFGQPGRDRILEAAGKEPRGSTLGRLRRALGEAALIATPPDLIILDEFQCYRELLNPAADNRLAARLLTGGGGKAPAVLLLSATPYRFYAERWAGLESGVAHHHELYNVIAFLGGPQASREAEALFGRFGTLLRAIGRLEAGEQRDALVAEAQGVKRELEALLAPILSRTERHGPGHAAPDPSAPPARPVARLEAHDLDVYRHFVEGVPDKLASSAIAYWLSVPLPAQALGPRYQIWKGARFRPPRGIAHLRAGTCFDAPRPGWGNPKLRALQGFAPADALALPWVPPSLPWWPPAGPWAKMDGAPKMLVFSRFRATPQSVAALLSLEVERKLAGAERSPYQAAWAKKKLNPKPNQGPTLALFHPSPFLIRAADPLAARPGSTAGQVRARIRRQIVSALPSGIASRAPNARANKRHRPGWEVLAAIERRSGDFDACHRSWRRLARKDRVLEQLLSQRTAARPLDWISAPELEDLVDMAMGGPGVVVGRALLRHHGAALDHHGDPRKDHCLALVDFCWRRLRAYFDTPVFWKRLPGEHAADTLQRAAVDGCLEATLDEHFWLRRTKIAPEELIGDLGKAFAANVGTFAFHTGRPDERGKIRIRCHAAVPFGGTESSAARKAAAPGALPPPRSEEIRAAFNTPFWPHVLATTSVGQEGLDFHSWCDRVGHWDLCGSPVDLEQREGRIQRFAGLMIRRRLADALGQEALAQAHAARWTSPWAVIAEKAEAKLGDETGLNPWWRLPGAEIKRHVFVLPHSRDIDRFERLRAQRLLYRLALGQPDQEDLVNLLANHDPEMGASLNALTLSLSAFSRRTG